MLKLNVEFETPLTKEDAEGLQATAMMTMAIANSALAGMGYAEEPEPEPEPEQKPRKTKQQRRRAKQKANGAAKKKSNGAEVIQTCGKENPLDASKVCISDPGHKGRHKYRDFGVEALIAH